MFALLLGLLFFVVVAGLFWWVIQQVPLPQPMRVVVTVIFVLICLLILLNYLPTAGLPHGRYL
jgi:hypothetical protein